MKNLNQDSPLHLADALAEEIVNTPVQTLLGEVTDDLGDRRALASEFDAAVHRALRQSRRKQFATSVENVGVWLSQHLFRKAIFVPVGTLAVLAVAVGGYHYRDARQSVSSVESLNLEAGSPRQPLMAPSFSASSKDSQAGIPESAAAIGPAAPMPSPPLQAQSDLLKALAAYDTARAYQAKERAIEALDRADYTAAITSLTDALRSCANRCQPELRAELDLRLRRAQSALNTGTNTAAAVAARSQPDLNAAAAVPPAKSSPSFAWPAKGRITMNFGSGVTALAPSHVQVETAEGITIAVPEGADIRAAADGIVSDVGDDKQPGKFLVVSHDHDLKTRYGHLRRVLVKVSDQVHRGEIIAKGVVSSRGAESQLYFEVQRGTAPVDPMQFLPQDQ